MWDKYSLCGYYRVCRFVYPTCCVTPPLKDSGDITSSVTKDKSGQKPLASDQTDSTEKNGATVGGRVEQELKVPSESTTTEEKQIENDVDKQNDQNKEDTIKTVALDNTDLEKVAVTKDNGGDVEFQPDGKEQKEASKDSGTASEQQEVIADKSTSNGEQQKEVKLLLIYIILDINIIKIAHSCDVN